MRILIVDDELVSRTKLELIMESFGECRTAERADDALAAFFSAHKKNEPFDLIMLDIGLPDMSGIEVLSTIRNAEKDLDLDKSRQAKVLMTSSHRDKDRIIASIQSGCDDYIGKPFNLELIRNKLQKIGIKDPSALKIPTESQAPASMTTGQIYGEIMAQLNAKQTELPSLSKIYVEFREMIALGSSLNEIVNLLRNDIAISAEIIRRSNSAYYRGFVATKSLEQAVARMGCKAIVQVVTELSIRDFFTLKIEKYRALIQNLWQHSISSAYAAEFLSKLLRLNLKGDPFLMGLLHDIGKLALLQIIADLERKGKINNDIHTIMLVNILQDYHCQLGARLLEKWKFDECYIHIALHHNRMDQETSDEAQADNDPYHKELTAVQTASRMVNLMGYDILASDPSDIDLSHIAPNKQLNLRSERIAETISQVTERMQEVQGLL